MGENKGQVFTGPPGDPGGERIMARTLPLYFRLPHTCANVAVRYLAWRAGIDIREHEVAMLAGRTLRRPHCWHCGFLTPEESAEALKKLGFHVRPVDADPGVLALSRVPVLLHLVRHPMWGHLPAVYHAVVLSPDPFKPGEWLLFDPGALFHGPDQVCTSDEFKQVLPHRWVHAFAVGS